jgi:glycosyltransferase involved in cell wall biosynthesis
MHFKNLNKEKQFNELVSVVIPVSNRAIEIKSTIASVLNQSHHNLEIIIVENNSHDPSLLDNTVVKFNDNRIFVYHMIECANANVARNYGVKMASGDYIAFLDSDDEWLPSHISNALEITTRLGVDFVYGSCFVWDGFKEKYHDARNLKKNEHPLEYLFGRDRSWAPTPSYFLDIKVFDSIEWDESLKRHQDFDFFVRVASKYKSAANLNYDVKVNWLAGEKRQYDTKSMIKFYQKWHREMSLNVSWNFIFGKIKTSIKQKSLTSLMYFSLIAVSLPFKYSFQAISKV